MAHVRAVDPRALPVIGVGVEVGQWDVIGGPAPELLPGPVQHDQGAAGVQEQDPRLGCADGLAVDGAGIPGAVGGGQPDQLHRPAILVCSAASAQTEKVRGVGGSGLLVVPGHGADGDEHRSGDDGAVLGG